MTEHTNNHTTLDDLARMINEGFKSTATKNDIEEVKHIQQDMLEELTATHADVRYLRSSVDILTRPRPSVMRSSKTL
jgi:exonuclease I